uniref:Putative ent-kaurene synthase n=1 Tax=Cladonia uncialis subsp. uncialis TaxID=180999 RepID=A0A1Z1CCW5_CLAUC|nr:putative ent-kaurene synthase [Cladonia uncialis subsp. uncialis]
MVNKDPRWAFPESFQFILEEQESDGDWDRSRNSDDGILNTLTALLVVTHPDLPARISKAIIYLEKKLQQWDVGASVHVDFEILVPKLLSMLEQEQLIFQFPQKQILMRLNADKLRHFDPSTVYGSQKHTLLRSLEGFIGKVDFDQIQHQKTNGSFMYSPSSTAAYLMSSSAWDDESEMYIRNAIMHGRGHGNGGVPSVFPSNTFEVTQVVSTLLQAGYTEESLDHRNVKDIALYLVGNFRAQEGLLGFAPSVLAAIDDTARAVITLDRLGRPTSPEKMLCFLDAERSHLRTYHVQDQIIPVLIQVLNRTLLTQHVTGGWSVNNIPEVNAYSILTLLALQGLPQARPLTFKIQSAIQAGRQVLAQAERQRGKPQYLWIEKVTYGSSILGETYCLAARNAPCLHNAWSDKVEKTVTTTATDAISLSEFFHRIPDYSDIPEWKILASVIEGSLYLQKLKVSRYEIFPRQQSSEDKYLNYIPCVWIIVNNCTGVLLDSTLVWDMMVILMLDFLVDEYMESVVAQLGERDIVSLQQIIRALCRNPDIDLSRESALPHTDSQLTTPSSGLEYGLSPSQPRNGYSEPLAAVSDVISTYVRAMVRYPRIQNASLADRCSLKAELEIFLLSHIDQIQDNHHFRGQDSCSLDVVKRSQNPRTNHYGWSHTTAANHTSCAVSLAFYTCRLSWNSSSGGDVFYTSHSKYMVGDLCSHLAVMTRLYNDYASIARDHAESNLNSINFPEFHSGQEGDATEANPPATGEIRARNTLLGHAQYERNCVETSFQTLVETLGKTTASAVKLQDALTLFVGVMNLFADMYVAKDLTNRAYPRLSDRMFNLFHLPCVELWELYNGVIAFNNT